MRRAVAEPGGAFRNLIPLLSRGSLLFLLGGTLIFSMILYATHLPHYQNGADVGYGVAAGCFAVGLISCALAIRTFRSGIILGPEGVLVRRSIHPKQFVPWLEVTGFDVVAAPLFSNRFTRTPVAVAVLRTGRPPLYCVGSSFSEPSSDADEMADELNEIRRSWFAAFQVRPNSNDSDRPAPIDPHLRVLASCLPCRESGASAP